MNIISLQNVVKTFSLGENEVHALRGVSFDIEQGGCVSIVGPSGSGKTTCMNMIGCLDRPTSGDVFVDGKNTATMKDTELAHLRNKTIGFVFQQYFLLPSFTVLENVMLPLRYQGISKSERKRLATEELEKVGLANRLKHKPNELSGGQKQRVAIARALVTKPKVILADEPTGALDSETGLSVLDLFLNINKTGTALVIVTHNMEIANMTKRLIHIKDGLVVEDTVQSNI
jgi:macrolide export ATP-binding/permease protein macB